MIIDMKKDLTIYLMFLLTSILCFKTNAQVPYTSIKATANHSISSSTLLSLEYAYEQPLSKISTIVFRAGLPNRVIFNSYITDGRSLHLEGRASLAYGVTIEPRIYTSLKRRASMSKKTLKNSSDFVAFRFQGTLGTPNYPTAEVYLVPMYGIRRVWGENWFGEFTVGGGISCHSLTGWTLNFKPHVQYRVGFIF